MDEDVKNENADPMSPVPSVPDVPFVSDKKDKKDIKDKGHHPCISQIQEFFFEKETKYKIFASLLEKDFNIKEIAEKTGTNPETIKKYVQRNPDHPFFEKIGDQLRLTEKGRYALEKQYEEHLQRNILPQTETDAESIANYVKEFRDFIQSYPPRVEGKEVFIDFRDLIVFSLTLGNFLLDEGKDALRCLHIALEEVPAFEDNKDFEIRLVNCGRPLPLNEVKLPSNLKKILCFQGDVVGCSEETLKITEADFECPSCGNRIKVIQNEKKFKEPFRCGCGRIGKFIYLADKTINEVKFTISESLEDISEDRRQSTIYAFAEGILAGAKYQSTIKSGKKLRTSGILSSLPKTDRRGVTLSEKNYCIRVLNVDAVEEDFSDLGITDEDKKIFEENPENMLSEAKKSFTSIYGMEDVKESLLLQQVGGTSSIKADGKKERGEIHIAITGDAGIAKTDLKEITAKISPKIKTIGAISSVAGIIGAVKKDNILDEWMVSGGAIVQANNGILVIDECEKLSPEAQNALHEALESGVVTIDKATVHKKLPANTACLLIANPKSGRFDEDKPLYQQVPFKFSLISRMDIVWTLVDKPDDVRDKQISEKILSRHNEQKIELKFDQRQIRKYIAYAKQTKPILSKEANEHLQQFYLRLRKINRNKAVITARQLESTIRLATAYAKWRLSKTVDAKDAERATELFNGYINLYCKDEDGKLDIDIINVGSSAKLRDDKDKVLEEIRKKPITTEELKQKFNFDIEEIIERLKRDGDIFETPKGVLRVTE